MMKKITLFVAAMVASMSMMAQSVYEKVKVAPADENWAGTYLIVCEGQGVVFNGAADEDHIDEKGTGAAIIAEVTISEDKISGTAALDAATFTISSSEDEVWPWAIQSASGLYIGHKDTTDNGLSTELELKGKCKHTLKLDENANLIATPKWTNSGEFNLQYNENGAQLRFRYFEPGKKQAVQLYKLVSPATSLKNVEEARATKYYENGQLVILKGGRKYNVFGQEL